MSRAKSQLPQTPQAVTANVTSNATAMLRRHGGAAGPTPAVRRRTRSQIPKSNGTMPNVTSAGSTAPPGPNHDRPTPTQGIPRVEEHHDQHQGDQHAHADP